MLSVLVGMEAFVTQKNQYFTCINYTRINNPYEDEKKRIH
ncbi:hypothetical protein SAMN04489724_4153 [Algoriphagus locisalis]|uniref:Uncharacterized protein n=1 Tax=Algoriphagus locisalis TaxID=305507 RepID=A0A1I7DM65_9BACT|nr:hypothetical protein SAMN04489724_4153 [Algoriphagus locisalis]